MSDVLTAIFLCLFLILSVMFALTPAYMLLRSYYSWEAEMDLSMGYNPSKLAEFMRFDKEWYDGQIESGGIKSRIPVFDNNWYESQIKSGIIKPSLPTYEPSLPDAPSPTSIDDLADNYAAQRNYNESLNSEEKPKQGINLH